MSVSLFLLYLTGPIYWAVIQDVVHKVYSRATGIPQTGIEATADKIGLGVAGVAGAAAIAHATVSAIKHARNKNNTSSENAPEEKK